MTALDMLPVIGKKVLVRFEDIEVVCIVKNVKVSYGNPRIEILPVCGNGMQWVDLSRIRQCLPEWVEQGLATGQITTYGEHRRGR